jgi:hypothetical protein
MWCVTTAHIVNNCLAAMPAFVYLKRAGDNAADSLPSCDVVGLFHIDLGAVYPGAEVRRYPRYIHVG